MMIVRAVWSLALKGLGCQAKEFSLYPGDVRKVWKISQHGQGQLINEMNLECRCLGTRGAELLYYQVRSGRAATGAVAVRIQRMETVMG